MTFSIMTFSIMTISLKTHSKVAFTIMDLIVTLNISIKCHYAECHGAANKLVHFENDACHAT